MRKKKVNKRKVHSVNSTTSGVSHIKSDKSNSFSEVSFDVLQNAVEQRNSEYGYTSKNFKNRAVISSDEMLYNKKHKPPKSKQKNFEYTRIGKLAVTTVILILIFAIVAAVAVNLSNNGYLIRARHSDPLKASIAEIAKHDRQISKLNDLLTSSINDTKLRVSNIDKQEFEDTKKELNELHGKISQISKEISSTSDDFEYIGIAEQSIESKIMMIETGLMIYDNASFSVSIINQTETFWNNVLKADALLKESDYLVQSNALDNYISAKEKSEESLNLLNLAKDEVVTLNSQTNVFDFEVYNQFIDARLESAKCSVAACQAMIEKNLDLMASLNVEYIQKANIASDIALTISTTPVQVLRADYDIKSRSLIEEYKAARTNAADNDFALRTYLASS